MTDNANANPVTNTNAEQSSTSPTPVPVMSDTPNPTNTASPSTLPPTSSPHKPPAPALAPAQTKGRRAKPKARPRRRAAADDDSDPESHAQLDDVSDSDSSLSDSSSVSDDDDEPEHLSQVDDEQKTSAKGAAPTSTFQDVSSVTPAGWADSGGGTAPPEILFDAFNRGIAPTRGRGRGRGGIAAGAGQQRELSEEEKKRLEEIKKKKKEKLKARRAEIKDLKKKQKEEGKGIEKQVSAPKDNKVKGKAKPNGLAKSVHSADSALVASTSALTLEDPAKSAIGEPATDVPESSLETPAATTAHNNVPKGRINNRDAYTQRLAADPKFTPRIGGFWTHDQRLYDAGPVGEGGYSGLRQMSEYWRGRGGPVPRGGRGAVGFRGRGRGFPAGPFAPGGFAYRQANPEPEALPEVKTEKKEEGDGEERVLEMDRLEAQLAAKETRARTSVSSPPEESGAAEATEATEAPVPPVALPKPKEAKWGHEAFEAIQSEHPRRSMSIRGRGRGRGGFVPRGGHLAGPGRPDVLPTPRTTPGQTHTNVPASQISQLSTSTRVPALPPAEQESTHPDADSLLNDSSSGHAFTVKLPGSDAAVEVSVPAAPETEITPAAAADGPPSSANAPTPASTEKPSNQIRAPNPQAAPFVNGNAVRNVPIFHPSSIPHPHSQPSPFPTASDSGSISSAGQFVPAPLAVPVQVGYGNGQQSGPRGQTFYPNGTPHGQGIPRAFPHQHQHQHQHQQGNFYPQQPSLYQDQFGQTHSQRGSFSGPTAAAQYFGPPSASGYSDGRNSPFANANGTISPNPYVMAQQQQQQQLQPNGNGNGTGGFFIPARQSSKVSIRSPAPGSQGQGEGKSKSGLNASTPAFATINSNSNQQQYPQGGQYYPTPTQHYNPYTAQQQQQQQQQQQYDPQGYYQSSNGYAWDPSVQLQSQGQGQYGYEGDYGY